MLIECEDGSTLETFCWHCSKCGKHIGIGLKEDPIPCDRLCYHCIQNASKDALVVYEKKIKDAN